MFMENNKIKLKPEGVKDFLPAEALAKEKIENRIMDVLKKGGYQEVITPTMEYGSIFAADLKAGLEERIYRFFDGRGGTLVLRPDWTLPLARLASNHLGSEALPLRLAYRGNIFRFESPQTGKRREIFQAGGELLGAQGAQADGEVLALALEALFAVDVKDLKICIGHTGFLSSLLKHFQVDQVTSSKIAAFLSKRDFVSLEACIAKDIKDPELKKSLLLLPGLKGNLDTIKKAADLLPAPARESILEDTLSLWENLGLWGLQNYVSFDFSFLRDLHYYTGFIFEIYSPHWGYPLGGGGRYDQLLDSYGEPLPAVGFALSIDYILSLWHQQQKVQKPAPDYFVCFESCHHQKAVQEVQRLRAEGFFVILDVLGLNAQEGLNRARKLGAETFIFYSSDGSIEQPVKAGS